MASNDDGMGDMAAAMENLPKVKLMVAHRQRQQERLERITFFRRQNFPVRYNQHEETGKKPL